MPESSPWHGCGHRRRKIVEASPDRVLALLRDYRDGRPRILTDNYSAYRVESGGAGRGHRDRAITSPPAAGSATTGCASRESTGELLERDELSSFVSTWSVAPSGAGTRSRSSPRGRCRRDRRVLRADVRADRAAQDLRPDARPARGAVGSA